MKTTAVYNEWFAQHRIALLEKLAKEDHSEGAKLTAEVIRYSHLKRFVLQGEKRPDIIIACGDDGELTEYAETMICDYFAAHPLVNLLYGDEDRKMPDGELVDPWLKPDWSPDTFLARFYFGNVFAVRSSELSLINPGNQTADSYEARSSIQADETEERRARFEEPDASLKSWIYGTLCMKLAQADGGFTMHRGMEFPIGHIPEILYHSNQRAESWESDLLHESLTGRFSIESAKSRLISIIIPSKDNPDMLKRCITSIVQHTQVPIELIIVDNGSSPENRKKTEELVERINENDRAVYLYEEMPFNMSKLLNIGAQEAYGDLLLFVHDDIEVQVNGWLSRMSEKAKLPYAGVVGIKLLYPNSHIIQHAGISYISDRPVYKLQYRSNEESYYFDYNKSVRNVLAVTGACMMVRAELFREVGGFDEKHFPAWMGDLDFCFRVFEKGYYNMVRNNRYLYYYESASPENRITREERVKGVPDELLRLAELHPLLSAGDPFYHKYLVQDPEDVQFHIDPDPRVR